MRSNGLRVVLASAVLGAMGACAQPPAQDAPAQDAPAQVAAADGAGAGQGEALYKERCATCHDNATERTPPRDVIAKNPPSFILAAMTTGLMQPMALGLSEDEMKAIALYLSPVSGARGTAGDPDANAIWGPSSAEMPLDAPKCEGPGPAVDPGAADQWIGWSPTLDNARYQPRSGIAAADVPKLKVKWAFHYPGSKNGQATIVGERLFVTSMSGAVYALNAKSGCVYWRHDAGAATRSSVHVAKMPAGSKAKTALFYSDWTKSAAAVDADTGELLWKTPIEEATGVQMTGSPTLYDNILLVPISTGNEAFATNDNYECCKFIGSLVALDAISGKVLWKRYTTDQKNLPYRLNAKGQQMWGPGGGSIWSAPTIDPQRGLVYVSTSNSHTDAFHEGANSVIAMEIRTGKVVWKNQVWPDDNYIIGCPRAANCPKELGPDFALGASPILHTQANGKQLLLAGQKSGILWALDPADGGKVVWKTQLSPGSALGGIEFGPAADEAKVYVGISDVILPADKSKAGLYALDVSDGRVVWSAPTPRLPCRWKNTYCNPAISQAVTAIPGVVFAASMDGRLRAYASADGKVIWDYDTTVEHTSVLGRPVYGGVMDGAGPTVAGGMLYVHSGYAGRQTANPNDLSGRDGNVLMAFSVDGK
jgi:polyvinyl alcohol dehydrogenase (cytochrome)